MAFSKIRMGQEELFTTIVEDQNGMKLEEWKVMKRDFPEVVRILANKFGLKMRVVKNDNNNDKQNRDLDWMR